MTAFDPLGLLDFHALHFRTAADDDIAVWAFGLLFHDGKDLRELPLAERKDLLMVLIMGAGDDSLRLSDGFDDGVELLAAAERMGLEGVVSKRRDGAPRANEPDRSDVDPFNIVTTGERLADLAAQSLWVEACALASSDRGHQ